MRNRIISEDEYTRILKHSHPRYKPIFRLLAETGFRVDDILKMRKWVLVKALDTGVLALTEDKTGKFRSVELSDVAKSVLRGLITPQKSSLSYVFPTLRRMYRMKRHRSTITRQFTAAAERAGLGGKGYTVHSLRKLYARRLYNKTRSLLAVQRDLNHSNQQTTMFYLMDFDL